MTNEARTLVQMYESGLPNEPPLPRLNEVWEFVGVLSIDPSASLHRPRGDAPEEAEDPRVAALAMAVNGMGLTDPEEELARHPPASLVPRLHCICTSSVTVRATAAHRLTGVCVQCADACVSLARPFLALKPRCKPRALLQLVPRVCLRGSQQHTRPHPWPEVVHVTQHRLVTVTPNKNRAPLLLPSWHVLFYGTRCRRPGWAKGWPSCVKAPFSTLQAMFAVCMQVGCLHHQLWD